MSGPKLLCRVRQAVRARHYSASTEEAYVSWVRRYVRFHGVRLPDEMGPAEITQFLTDLAVQQGVSAATQNQAASALVFLYREVLGRELEREEILVRAGKGNRDRVTMLPQSLLEDVGAQVERVRGIFTEDLKRGGGYVLLPGALERKSPADGRAFPWQYLFPATRASRDSQTSRLTRHHLHPSAIQRCVKRAVRTSGIAKRATCHTFLRNASPGGRLQHPDGPGATRPQERSHHDDLHPCPEPRRTGSEEPPRSPGVDVARGSLTTTHDQKERRGAHSVTEGPWMDWGQRRIEVHRAVPDHSRSRRLRHKRCESRSAGHR